MNKLNEFVNNLDKIELKFEKLIEDTKMYSSFNQIIETDIFKDLLKCKKSLIPFLIEYILKEKTNIAFFLLFDQIEEIEIKEENSGNLNKMKEDYRKWWESNKHLYGK
jgi:hypothetical protein